MRCYTVHENPMIGEYGSSVCSDGFYNETRPCELGIPV